jgi:hypothetical protein
MAGSVAAIPVATASGSRRATGVLLLLTAVSLLITLSLSDPAIEEHHVSKKFIEQVERSADRAPGIYAFQVVEVARGFLTASLGVALHLTLRGAAPGLGLGGLVMFGMAGVFTAGTAFIGAGTTTAAQLYSGGHLEGTGAGSTDLLAVIQVFTVLHFAFFLAAFAGLGLGIAAFSRTLKAADAAPRWLVGLGLVSGVLLCLSWLTFIKEILFLPFFLGIVLSLVWLITMGVRLIRAR